MPDPSKKDDDDEDEDEDEESVALETSPHPRSDNNNRSASEVEKEGDPPHEEEEEEEDDDDDGLENEERGANTKSGSRTSDKKSRKNDDDNDDDGDGDDPREQDEEADVRQLLLCDEPMEAFVDPTLFRRLIVASSSSQQQGGGAGGGGPKAGAGAGAEAEAEEEAKEKEPPHPGGSNKTKRKVPDMAWAASSEAGDTAAFALAHADADADAAEAPSPKPKPKPKPRAATAKAKAKAKANAAAALEDLSLQVLQPYMYSWEAIGLGRERGTPAWNRVLRQRLQEQSGGSWHDRVPQLTSEEALDVVRCRCRIVTIRPPVDSAVAPLPSQAGPPPTATPINKVDREDDDRHHWAWKLSRLYGAMIAQDATLGLKRYHDVTAKEVLEKMRQIENDRARLQVKEHQVVALSRRLGLMSDGGNDDEDGGGDDATRIEALQLRGKAFVDRTDPGGRLYRHGNRDGTDAEDEPDPSAPLAHPKDARKRQREQQKQIAHRRRRHHHHHASASARHGHRHRPRKEREYWRPDFAGLLAEKRRRQGGECLLYPHDAY